MENLLHSIDLPLFFYVVSQQTSIFCSQKGGFQCLQSVPWFGPCVCFISKCGWCALGQDGQPLGVTLWNEAFLPTI